MTLIVAWSDFSHPASSLEAIIGNRERDRVLLLIRLVGIDANDVVLHRARAGSAVAVPRVAQVLNRRLVIVRSRTAQVSVGTVVSAPVLPGSVGMLEGLITAVGGVLMSQIPAPVVVTLTVFVSAAEVAVTVIDVGAPSASVRRFNSPSIGVRVETPALP